MAGPGLRAGEMDDLIVIKTITESKEATYGSKQEVASDFATLWSDYRPRAGRQFFEAEQIKADRTGTFRIYWIAGLKATMKIEYDGDLWDIHRIDEIGRREGIEIFATAKRE